MKHPVALYNHNTNSTRGISLDRAVKLLKENYPTTRECLVALCTSHSANRVEIGGGGAGFRSLWLLEG